MNTQCRLKTFVDWSRISPDAFTVASAGFVFVHDDVVRCPWCNLTIGGWEDDDDPLVIHKTETPKCYFL